MLSWEWLFALAGDSSSSPTWDTLRPGCPGWLSGKAWESLESDLSRKKMQKAWKPRMRGKGPVSKGLLCGDLSVLPKLISDLLSEDLPHLASSPSYEAVLKHRIQFKDVDWGPFFEGRTWP